MFKGPLSSVGTACKMFEKLRKLPQPNISLVGGACPKFLILTKLTLCSLKKRYRVRTSLSALFSFLSFF